MRAPLCLATIVSASLFAATASADPPAPPPAAPASTTAPAAAPPATPAPDAKPASPAGTIHVHIDSPVANTDVEHRAGPNAPWENICVTPCDVDVAVGDDYRVLGIDVAPSDPFQFDGSKGNNQTLTVRPASIRKARTGLWILGGAGVLGVASIITLAAGAASDGFGAGGVATGRDDVLFAGAFMLIGALGVGAFGGAWYVNNGTSKVEGPVLDTTKKNDAPPPPKASFSFPLVRVTF